MNYGTALEWGVGRAYGIFSVPCRILMLRPGVYQGKGGVYRHLR
jgi:hypothetical protein